MINRVVLVGRLTRDVDVRKTSSSLSVATFTVACNRRVAKGQEAQTDFINCVAWRQTADFLGQYARKGALVGVEGRIQTRNYDDPTTGKKVYVTEVVADSVQLLESRAASENRASNGYQQNAYSGMNANSGYYPDSNPEMDMYGAGPALDISSDDLPF